MRNVQLECFISVLKKKCQMTDFKKQFSYENCSIIFSFLHLKRNCEINFWNFTKKIWRWHSILWKTKITWWKLWNLKSQNKYRLTFHKIMTFKWIRILCFKKFLVGQSSLLIQTKLFWQLFDDELPLRVADEATTIRRQRRCMSWNKFTLSYIVILQLFVI